MALGSCADHRDLGHPKTKFSAKEISLPQRDKEQGIRDKGRRQDRWEKERTGEREGAFVQEVGDREEQRGDRGGT